MKIVIIVRGFPPFNLGGTEIATEYIAKFLNFFNYNVDILTENNKENNLPKFEKMPSYTIYRLSNTNLNHVDTVLFSLKCIPYLKRLQPEIILIQGFENTLSGYLFKKLFGTSYVIWGRGSDVYNTWLFKNPILKIGIKTADGIVALTEDMKSKLTNFYNKRIDVIPNGIDINEFFDRTQIISNHFLKKQQNEKIIIYVGSLRSVKGVNYLIDAFKLVRQKRNDVKLLLIGDGYDRKTLECQVNMLKISDYVIFLGLRPHKEIPSHLKMADIFVLPSLYEGFPNVLLEAMAAGLPIVATNVTGIPEIIKNETNGFIVNPNSSSEIAEKILFLLENPDHYYRISNNNDKEVKKYSWIKVVEKLSNLFLEIHSR